MYFNKKNLFSAIIIFLFIFILLEYKLFSFYIPPIKNNFGDIVKFGDWSAVVDLAKCFQLGIDVFNVNQCDVTGRPHVYGTSLLYLPGVLKFYTFYLNVMPLVIIFLLIFFLNTFLNPKTILENLSMICIILSTPFILAIERLNVEIIIFFFLIMLSLLNNSIIQKFIIIVLSSIKFYPATLGLFFLKKKISGKIFIKNFLFLMIILLCLYLDKEQILNILAKRNLINPSTVDNVGFLIFSFYGIPELAKSTILHMQFFDLKKNDFAYLFYYIFLFIITAYVLIQCSKQFFNNKFILNLQELNFKYFEDKLFIFSIILILTIYFMSMNYVYKEIYFLGLIPLLKKNKKIKKDKLSKKIYNLIIIKFILLSFLWIAQITFFSSSIYFKGFNILIKNLIDLYLVTILLKIFLSFILKSLNKVYY